ncbi:MAG: methyl-accepting chemotaxis protein [bacterium]|nr:methyl-accepting chemotaxis protein [bacterium]
MTIKTRLILLLLFPICVILGFGLQGFLKSHAIVSELDELHTMARIAVASSSLLHETQKERGMSAGYLGSKGARNADTLPKQRLVADERIAELEELLESADKDNWDEGFTSSLERAMTDLSRIDDIRTQISALEISTPNGIAYYSNMNAAFLDAIKAMVAASSNAELAINLTAYVSFLEGKEHAGIERALMSNAMAGDRFGPGQYTKFISQVRHQKVSLAAFEANTSPDALSFYQTTVQGDAIDEVARLREIARKSVGRRALMAETSRLTGYGGIIHQFKNYVLRRDPKYGKKIDEQYRTLSAKFDEYVALLPPGSPHIEAVSTYRKTLEDYRKQAELVGNLAASGQTTEQIDAAVKISDGPAIDALQQLMTTSGFGVDPDQCFKIYTGKIDLLRKVELSLSGSLEQNSSELRSSAVFARALYGVLALIAMIVTAVGGVMVVRSILAALAAMKDAMADIGSGNLTRQVDTHGSDELSDLGRSINGFVDNLRATIAEVVSQCRSLDSASDALTTASTEMVREVGHISEQSTSVAGGAEELKSNIEHVAQTTQESNSAIGSASASVEEMSANLGDVTKQVADIQQRVVSVSAAVEEMSASASSVSSSTAEAATTTEQAIESAKGADQVMRTLANSAGEATGMIQTIDDIAAQINLLALNATIEAASAGEFGRGFAVVANEVKELAGQTAKATNEIRARIEGIQLSTEEAMAAMQSTLDVIVKTGEISRLIDTSAGEQQHATSEIAENLARNAESAKGITRATEECSVGASEAASRVGQISNGTVEIAKNMVEASQGAEDISKAIQQVSSGLDQIAGGATTVEESAKSLRGMSTQLSEMVSQFTIE